MYKYINITLTLILLSIFLVGNYDVKATNKIGNNAYYIVIDCSGSNHDFYLPKESSCYKCAKEVFSFKGTDPLDLRIAAARILVSLLDEDDQVGVLIYYSKLETDDMGIPKNINYSLEEDPSNVVFDEIVPMQKIGRIGNRKKIISNLDEASKSEGLTYMRGLFDKTSSTLKQLTDVKDKYIVFFTDGAPTHSFKTPSKYKDFNEMTTVLKNEVVEEAKKAIDKNISVYTICYKSKDTKVGNSVIKSYDHSFFLQEIADYSKLINKQGGFFKIEKANDLISVFTDIFSETKSCFFRKHTSDVIELSPITERLSVVSVGSNNDVRIMEPDDSEVTSKNEDLYFHDQKEQYSIFNFLKPNSGKWKIVSTSPSTYLSIIEDIDIKLEILSPDRGDKLFVNEDSLLPIEFSLSFKNPEQIKNVKSLSYWIDAKLIELSIENEEVDLESLLYPPIPTDCNLSKCNHIVEIPFNSFKKCDIKNHEKQYQLKFRLNFNINGSENLTYSTPYQNVYLLSKQRIVVNNSECVVFNEWHNDLKDPISIVREVQVNKLSSIEYPNLTADFISNILESGEVADLDVALNDENRCLELSIPVSNFKQENPFFNNTEYQGMLIIKTHDETFDIFNGEIPIRVVYESFISRYGVWLILLFLLLVLMLLYFSVNWISQPYFTGYILVNGRKIRLKHKNILRKLFSKTVLIVGHSKNCDLYIPHMNKETSFQLRIMRKKIRNRTELVIKPRRIKGQLDLSSLDKRYGLRNRDIFHCNGVQIEYLR